MILNIGGRRYPIGKLSYVIRATHHFQLSRFSEVAGYGKDIDRLRSLKQIVYGLIYFFVAVFVERVRA